LEKKSNALVVSGKNLFAGAYDYTKHINALTVSGKNLFDGDFDYAKLVHALAVSGKNIFAGTYVGVFLSTNNGTSWNKVNTGLTGHPIRTLAVSDAYIFAGTDGDGVWRRPITEFVVTPIIHFNVKTVAFSHTKIGEFKDTIVIFTNMGNDTLKINNVLSSNSAVFSVRKMSILIPPFASFTDTLRFSPDSIKQYSEKIFIYSNTLTSPDSIIVSGVGLTPVTVENFTGELPKIYSLSQNYPNPFNPATTIYFSIPLNSFVSLKIYDDLGREVSILVSENLSAGIYARRWNAKNLPSGIYFYRLQAGSFSETKKLILLK